MLNFLDGYKKNMNCEEVENGFELTIPFRFFNDETILTLHLQKNQSGYYDIDDNGNTLKYLNNMDVNLDDYTGRVEIICELFSLKIENGLVKGVIGYGTNQLYKQFHNFLQGISHLSTIKYFD